MGGQQDRPGRRGRTHLALRLAGAGTLMNGLRVAAKTNPDERTLIQRWRRRSPSSTDRNPGSLAFPRPDGTFPRAGRGHARRFVDQMIHKEKKRKKE